MRTTVDIPDELFRQVKARAALRGLKLKEYVAEALRASLIDQRQSSEVREAESLDREDVIELGEDCVLPQISGETSEVLRSITEQRIEEILEEEELDRALRPGGR